MKDLWTLALETDMVYQKLVEALRDGALRSSQLSWACGYRSRIAP